MPEPRFAAFEDAAEDFHPQSAEFDERRQRAIDLGIAAVAELGPQDVAAFYALCDELHEASLVRPEVLRQRLMLEWERRLASAGIGAP